MEEMEVYPMEVLEGWEEAEVEVEVVRAPTSLTTTSTLGAMTTSTVTTWALAMMFLSTVKTPGLSSMLEPTNPSVAGSTPWAGPRPATWTSSTATPSDWTSPWPARTATPSQRVASTPTPWWSRDTAW